MTAYDGYYYNVFGEESCATLCVWKKTGNNFSYHDPNISTVIEGEGYWTCRTDLESVSFPPTQAPTKSPTLPPDENPCPEGEVQRLVCNWRRGGCKFKCVKPKAPSGGNSTYRNTPLGFFSHWDKLKCTRSDQVFENRATAVLSSSALWTPLWCLLVIATAFIARRIAKRQRMEKEDPDFSAAAVADGKDPEADYEAMSVDNDGDKEKPKVLSMEFESPVGKKAPCRRCSGRSCPKGAVVFCKIFGALFWLFISLIVWLSWLESLGVALPNRLLVFSPSCSAREQCSGAKSFRNDAKAPTSEAFSLIIASDAQVKWYNGEYEIGKGMPTFCSSEEPYRSCANKVAETTNREQVEAFEALSRDPNYLLKFAAPAPRGLIMNGDLTAYFHKDQLHQYESFFHNLPDTIDSYYPSLGNHDYLNNLGHATYYLDTWFIDENCNAEHAVAYMRSGLGCGTIPKLHTSRLQSFDRDSLAYSWNQGNYHFAVVNFHPTYAPGVIRIKPSMAWLTRDLHSARDQGYHNIVITHSATGMSADFKRLAQSADVKAIFGAHLHRCIGKSCAWPSQGSRGSSCTKNAASAFDYEYSGGSSFYFDPDGEYNCTKTNYSQYALVLQSIAGGGDERHIPVFWSGSSSFQTFLAVAFNDTGIHVEAMSSKGGKASPLGDIHSLPGVVYPYTTTEDVSGIFVPV